MQSKNVAFKIGKGISLSGVYLEQKCTLAISSILSKAVNDMMKILDITKNL